MLTLFHAPLTRSFRVLWAIEELGADCDVRQVSITRHDGSGARDPANPHPDGKVPALLHDGALVTESVAILILLNDLHPASPVSVPPDDPRRGPFLSWLLWYAGVGEPLLMLGFMGQADNPFAARSFRSRADYDARILSALETGPWLCGDRFTLVDLLLASTGQWMRGLLPEGEKVDEWLSRCSARPACLRAQGRDGTV